MKSLNQISRCVFLLLLAAILSVTVSFSWLIRPHSSASKAVDTLTVKSITAATKYDFIGTYSTKSCSFTKGQVVADSTTTNTIAAGAVNYYRTSVKNNGTVKVNITLSDLMFSTRAANITINGLFPLKTTASYTNLAANTGVTVAKHISISPGETVNIDWYVYNKGTSSVTISSFPQISFSK